MSSSSGSGIGSGGNSSSGAGGGFGVGDVRTTTVSADELSDFLRYHQQQALQAVQAQEAQHFGPRQLNSMEEMNEYLARHQAYYGTHQGLFAGNPQQQYQQQQQQQQQYHQYQQQQQQQQQQHQQQQQQQGGNFQYMGQSGMPVSIPWELLQYARLQEDARLSKAQNYRRGKWTVR